MRFTILALALAALAVAAPVAQGPGGPGGEPGSPSPGGPGGPGGSPAPAPGPVSRSLIVLSDSWHSHEPCVSCSGVSVPQHE